jgi:competence protein ComEC
MLSMLAAIAAMRLRSRARARDTCIALAIMLTAAAAAQIEAFQYPRDHIGNFASDQPHLAKLELALDQPLRILSTPPASPNARVMPPRQVTTARVLRVLTAHGWIPASGETLLQIDPPNESLAVGQTIRVLGLLQRPAPAMNPGQFDWSAYYRQDRVLSSINVRHSEAIEILARGAPSPLTKLRQYVRAALARGFDESRSLEHALLRALVLGDGDPELSDVREQFRRTGTSHHLAISGMHVAVLGAVVYGICHLCMLRPRACAWIGLIAVVLYGIVALPSPPVVRSVVLCASVAVGILGRRSVDAIQLLALSVLAMLIYKPLDLYNAGFQLSFGTVLGLMLLTRRVMPMLRDVDADVALRMPGTSRPPLRLRVRHALWRWFTPILVAGVVAWLVSLPLIAFHFEQLNPYAVLASLLLAPVVFLALIGGFMKILLTMLIPSLAHAWAVIASWPVSWMRHGVEWLAMLPGSDVPLPSHSILFIVVYYLLLLAPLYVRCSRPGLRRTVRCSPGFALMLFVLVPLTGIGATSRGDGALRVNVLAVGAGQCCVIETPDGKVVLLDAGSMTVADAARRLIGPYLRSRGHIAVDELWLADCDFDHLGAATEIIHTFGVKRVVVSGCFERDAEGKSADEALLETVRSEGVKLERLWRGDHAQLGRGVTVEVLWPPRAGGGIAGVNVPSNNRDLVLKVTYARRTILFPADVQQPAQAGLLRHGEELRCDAMLAPHHGSGETTTPAFIATADPLYIVSSNDRTLTQKQRLFERQVGGRQLFRTSRDGAVTITIDRTGGLTVAPFVKRSE